MAANAKKIPPAPRGGTPQGHRPEHGTHTAVVQSRQNKGIYTPSTGGAKGGMKGRTPRGAQ